MDSNRLSVSRRKGLARSEERLIDDNHEQSFPQVHLRAPKRDTDPGRCRKKLSTQRRSSIGVFSCLDTHAAVESIVTASPKGKVRPRLSTRSLGLESPRRKTLRKKVAESSNKDSDQLLFQVNNHSSGTRNILTSLRSLALNPISDTPLSPRRRRRSSQAARQFLHSSDSANTGHTSSELSNGDDSASVPEVPVIRSAGTVEA